MSIPDFIPIGALFSPSTTKDGKVYAVSTTAPFFACYGASRPNVAGKIVPLNNQVAAQAKLREKMGESYNACSLLDLPAAMIQTMQDHIRSAMPSLKDAHLDPSQDGFLVVSPAAASGPAQAPKRRKQKVAIWI